MIGTPAERYTPAHIRAAWYGFLAWLFLEQPDAAFIDRLLSSEMESQLRSCEPSPGAEGRMAAGLQALRLSLAENRPEPTEGLYLALAVEHTRLMRGVAREYGPPPPYESLYRKSRSRGETSVLADIGEFYRQAQVDLLAEGVDRLDYLGLELDMMRLLCEEEGKCWNQGDPEAAAGFIALQRCFLREHLLAWVPGYCHTLLAATPSRFYQAVAHILQDFLEQEAEIASEYTGESPAPTTAVKTERGG